MISRDFDERQLQIRGEIFFHGLITALALLLINALLLGNNIVWATGFQQNIIIIVLIGMVVIIKAILRDAFFGMGQMRWPIIGTFGVISLVLLAWGIGSVVYGNALFSDQMLTDTGFLLVSAIMPVSVTIAGLAKEIVESRNNKD